VLDTNRHRKPPKLVVFSARWRIIPQYDDKRLLSDLILPESRRPVYGAAMRVARADLCQVMPAVPPIK